MRWPNQDRRLLEGVSFDGMLRVTVFLAQENGAPNVPCVQRRFLKPIVAGASVCLVVVFAVVWAMLPQSGPIEAVDPRFRVVSARITHSDWHELYFGGASGKMRDFLSNFLPITGPGGIRAGFPEKRTALTISYTGTLSAQELDSIQAFVVYPDGRTVMLRLHVFGSSTERKEFARVWELPTGLENGSFIQLVLGTNVVGRGRAQRD